MTDPTLRRGEVLAWHWLPADRRLRDGNIAQAGYVYEVPGPVELCAWGLHASVSPLHALDYAQGPIISRVVMSGDITHGGDKLVARRREVLWTADATDVLWHSARLAALDVIHLWDAPEVVRQYLTTGDESLRAAARVAARVAARAAARVAARAAAWAAARDAAWAAARDAAWAAARVAAWAAAWDAAWAAQSTRLHTMLMELAP
jgi:hypothetical protein